jgi:hypothetical protein
MFMPPISSTQFHIRPEILPPKTHISLIPESEASRFDTDITTLTEGICNDRLVLIDSDGTSCIDYDAAGGGVGIDCIDGMEEHVLL